MAQESLRPENLVLRCLAEQRDGQWSAICLNLCLAAQGDSLQEVKQKLDLMIAEYVHDALAGEDQAHARYLLTQRKAPLRYWVKYYAFMFVKRLHLMKQGVKGVLFDSHLPLSPTGCC